jgi:hypothetical protein
MKRALIIVVVLFFAVLYPSTGQERQAADIEQSYSPDYVNLILIREQSIAPEWSLKMEALALIGKVLAQDNRAAEILSALEYMALEGTVNKARVNGVIINNYPDIRAKSAAYLGDFGGSGAKKILIQVLKSDDETMVLAEAVKALARIGLVAEDEALINDMMRRFDTRLPDNFLAMAVLDAYQTYAQARNGILNIATRDLIFQIQRKNYRAPVKEKARHLIALLQEYRKQPISADPTL